MNKLNKNNGEEIIYSLNIDDLQKVSQEVLQRRLTTEEIASVQESVGNYIDWFHVIEDAILEKVGVPEPA